MDFVKHPNIKKFIDESIQNSKTQSAWDFNTCLGDTIKEKYESMYLKLNELTTTLIKTGTSGYFWILTNPDIASIFETASAGFAPAPSSDGACELVRPMGLKITTFHGSVSYKWKLSSSCQVPDDVILVGADTGPVGVLEVANLIF